MDTLTSTLQVNVTLFPVNKEPMTLTETIGAGSVCKELKSWGRYQTWTLDWTLGMACKTTWTGLWTRFWTRFLTRF